ncbi:hypothetical protein AB0G04_43415 [Actinoplanes sp. NPDC023801]|uniref:hypothetical protein n=1 Tax=Actinoplanes sp. NPDC023801 TaxID=3154595 RepID=UPI0033CC0CBD
MSRPEYGFGPGQLARWLGLKEWQVRRARERGLIPEPDLAEGRWSYEVARVLPDRVEEIAAQVGDVYVAPGAAASVPAGDAAAVAGPAPASKGARYGPIQLARELGLKQWQVPRAVGLGLIPAADLPDGRWSVPVVESLAGHGPGIAEAVGDHPGLGAEKAAERLAERTGLAVQRCDVQELSERGLLASVGEFRGWPLYSLQVLDEVPVESIASVVAAREAWLARSLSGQEAADLLGWPLGRFEVTAERQGLTPGRFDRFDRADVESLGTPR